MRVLLMNNKIKEKSVKSSFGGISAALSLIIMAVFGLFPSMTYAAPVICGIFIAVAVIEFNSKFAFALYLAVSVLSLAIVPNKESAVFYALFFGIYPILKGLIERKTRGAFSWVIKYIIFNIAIVAAYLICSKLLNIPYDEIGAFGKFTLLFLWGSGNAAFLFYDIAFTRIVTLYIYKWQKYIKRLLK